MHIQKFQLRSNEESKSLLDKQISTKVWRYPSNFPLLCQLGTK